jgi:hypothetical protein
MGLFKGPEDIRKGIALTLFEPNSGQRSLNHGYLIPNPLSNAQKTGFSEKPVFYSCKGQPPLPPDIGGVGGIDNQSLITGFSIKPAKIKKRSENNHSY